MPAKRGKSGARAHGQQASSEEYGEEAAALAADLLNGDCVVFAGAGVSADALPKWPALIARLTRALPEFNSRGSTPGDFLDVAQWYVEEHGRDTLLREMARIYDGPRVKPTALARALAQLPARVYFTTNYDRTLEMALRENFRLPDVVVDDRHIALIDERGRTTVVKMHGSVTRPDSIVLTREDYTTYGESHRATITYLQSLLATRTVLFVGFSFSDPNFQVIYDAIQRPLGRYRRQPYALVIDPGSPLMVRHWERAGVRMLTFPQKGGGEAVLAFVRQLGNLVREQRQRGTFSLLLERLVASEPAPSFPEAREVAAHLEQAAALVTAMVREAVENDPTAPAPPAAGDDGSGAEDNARSLYQLAASFENLGLRLAADDWVRLGSLLYARGDLGGAVHAYTTAVRRRVEEGDASAAGRKLDPWITGNLARAYAGLNQFARAEDLLREIVLAGPREKRRLNVAWLRRRPGDLSQLGHVVNTTAAQAAADGDVERASEVLEETGQWLEQGLARGLFAEKRGADAEPLASEAHVLSAIGTNHRLRYQLAMRRYDFAAAREHCRRAAETLERSLTADPYLAGTWNQLLALYLDGRHPECAGAERVGELASRLEELAKTERGRAVREEARERLPEAWSSLERRPTEDESARKRKRSDNSRPLPAGGRAARAGG